MLFLAASGSARDIPVANKAALGGALSGLAAGDTLTLSDGDWADAVIRIAAAGTAAKPILVRAANPGKAVLKGSSRIVFEGGYITATGFLMQGASSRTSEAVVFATGSSDCRFTNSAIEGYNMAGGDRDIWIAISGIRNRVDHCSFTGKKNEGITVRVRRYSDDPDLHVIARNYFGARPAINANGAEEIQLGLMETQFSESRSVVEYNLFEECNGEPENISVKSGADTIRYNTFLRCESHLTLRHGSGSVVVGNFIDGRGAAGTGGIRICGKNHTVAGNFITGLRGTDESGGGINIHGGDASDPKVDPANHVPSRDCLITYNTLVDNQQGIVYGGQGPTAPTGAILANNIIQSATGTLFSMRATTPFAKAEGNILSGPTLGISGKAGILIADPQLVKSDLNGYPHFLPAAGSPALGMAVAGYAIPGWTGAMPSDVGENFYGQTKAKPLARSDVGPAWKGGPSSLDPVPPGGILAPAGRRDASRSYDAAGRSLSGAGAFTGRWRKPAAFRR